MCISFAAVRPVVGTFPFGKVSPALQFSINRHQFSPTNYHAFFFAAVTIIALHLSIFLAHH
jgi:hypothetical protein